MYLKMTVDIHREIPSIIQIGEKYFDRGIANGRSQATEQHSRIE
jgi:hypothetical protein